MRRSTAVVPRTYKASARSYRSRYTRPTVASLVKYKKKPTSYGRRKKVPYSRRRYRRRVRRVTNTVRPTFRIAPNGAAMPIVPYNAIYISMVGKRGTIFFKRVIMKNIQYVQNATQFGAAIVRSPVVKTILQAYLKYYGTGARVVMYRASNPSESADGLNFAKELSVMVEEYMIALTSFFGQLKTRSLAVEGLDMQQVLAPLRLDVTPNFARTPVPQRQPPAPVPMQDLRT